MLNLLKKPLSITVGLIIILLLTVMFTQTVFADDPIIIPGYESSEHIVTLEQLSGRRQKQFA